MKTNIHIDEKTLRYLASQVFDPYISSKEYEAVYERLSNERHLSSLLIQLAAEVEDVSRTAGSVEGKVAQIKAAKAAAALKGKRDANPILLLPEVDFRELILERMEALRIAVNTFGHRLKDVEEEKEPDDIEENEDFWDKGFGLIDKAFAGLDKSMDRIFKKK